MRRKFLAEGPTSGENIQIRDVATRKVVQSFANGAQREMKVPRMAYSQGGQVLIACDCAGATTSVGQAGPGRHRGVGHAGDELDPRNGHHLPLFGARVVIGVLRMLSSF